MENLDVNNKIAKPTHTDDIELSKFKTILDEISEQNQKVVNTLYRLNERISGVKDI